MALVGPLVVAAISVAAGSGREPAEEVKVSMRHVSTSEAMDILRKFPQLIPDFLAKRKDDAEYMAGTFGFVEVTIAPLARIFPAARFYRGHNFNSPPYPYLMAIEGDKCYGMPQGFNRLLIDNGLKVTDKNIIELAKAFVTVAIGEGLPKVTFLQATRTKQVISGRSYSVRLEVRTDEQTEEWFFSLSYWRDQFGTVYRRGPHGYIDQYDPATAQPSPGHGQLNLGTPSVAIDTIRMAAAQAERDSLRTGLTPAMKPELEDAAGSARMLTDSEAVQVGRRFPALGVRPGGISLVRDDLLDHLFPKTVFYRILHGGRPSSPYLISVTGDSVFPMPSGLNLLLREQGIEVSDDNIIDLAKAFVIIAIANRPPATLIDEFSPLDFIPRITFLGEQRIEQRDLRNPCAVDAQITCRIGSGDTQTWRFSQGRDRTSEGVRVKVGQFGAVRVAIGAKPIWVYQPVSADDETRR